RTSASVDVAPVALVVSVGELPTHLGDSVPIADEFEVERVSRDLQLARMRGESGSQIARSSRRLYFEEVLAAKEPVRRAFKRPLQNGVAGWRGDRIVVDVKHAIAGWKIGAPYVR